MDDVGDARLRRLEIAQNGRGVVLGTGFGATGLGSLRLVRSHVHDNAGAGVAASGWRFATTISFSNSNGGEVLWSRIVGNRTGVVFDFSPGGRVVGNLMSRNGVWGLFGFRSGGMTATDNVITFNGTPAEFSGGAWTSEGGLLPRPLVRSTQKCVLKMPAQAPLPARRMPGMSSLLRRRPRPNL